MIWDMVHWNSKRKTKLPCGAFVAFALLGILLLAVIFIRWELNPFQLFFHFRQQFPERALRQVTTSWATSKRWSQGNFATRTEWRWYRLTWHGHRTTPNSKCMPCMCCRPWCVAVSRNSGTWTCAGSVCKSCSYKRMFRETFLLLNKPIMSPTFSWRSIH